MDGFKERVVAYLAAEVRRSRMVVLVFGVAGFLLGLCL